MFIIYQHVNANDRKILHIHNKLVVDDRFILDNYVKGYDTELNDIFLVHITIPHSEPGEDKTTELEFNMDLNRLEVNKVYKIPFEEKIHSFILREDGFLDYYIHF